MVRLARILRDYRESGSLNTLLALWGFVDERTSRPISWLPPMGTMKRYSARNIACFWSDNEAAGRLARG